MSFSRDPFPHLQGSFAQSFATTLVEPQERETISEGGPRRGLGRETRFSKRSGVWIGYLVESPLPVTPRAVLRTRQHRRQARVRAV